MYVVGSQQRIMKTARGKAIQRNFTKKKWKNENLKETVSEIENKQKHIE